METTIDLMTPRYEVIADYPGSGHKVGDILYPRPFNDVESWGKNLSKYPAIFRPLAWWERREEKDFTHLKFVKIIKKGLSLAPGTIVIVDTKNIFDDWPKGYEKEASQYYFTTPGSAFRWNFDKVLPSNNYEYDQYTSSKQ